MRIPSLRFDVLPAPRPSAQHRRRRSHQRRSAVAALEVVLATAVALPLAVMMFLLGVQICRYVFRGFDGMLTMPWL